MKNRELIDKLQKLDLDAEVAAAVEDSMEAYVTGVRVLDNGAILIDATEGEEV